MAFQISPGVQVTEVDLTTIIPAVATTDGAFVGTFAWGPVDEIVLVDSQAALVNRFGKPNADNFEHWFTASNFLDYGNKLNLVRVVDSSAAENAHAGDVSEDLLIKNEAEYDTATLSNAGTFAAKYPGALGNALRVSVCDSVPGQFSNTEMNFSANTTAGSRVVTFFGALSHNNDFVEGDVITFGTYTDAPETDLAGTVDGSDATTTNVPQGSFKVVAVNVSSPAQITLDREVPLTVRNMKINREWEFYNNFDQAPGTSEYASARNASDDEIHIAISDATGAITGTKGTVLETFANVSKGSDAKNEDGTSNYYVDVINNQSEWVWFAEETENHTTDGTAALGDTIASAAGDTYEKIVKSVSYIQLPLSLPLQGGTDGNATAPGPFQLGYDLFNNPEEVDISLVICGPHGGTVSRYVIDNLAEDRKDCVAFLSPESTDCVNVANIETALTNVKNYRTTTDGINGKSSSYAVMDSGWKYQYDKFNDVYRWVPLSADIAGLCVNTDNVRDPWYSPAGLNRGQVKNVVKLAWNPRRAHRDELYKNGINPVVTLPGQGTVLFGDKTLQSKPSAFDRINVRRLFIVLEKAIATAAKYTLFEFNDEFTRAQFRNLVEPFLRDVQGRRGIFDFRVVCDATNNTPDVIDRNEFVGDIYIKPARSINFITLNFVAARTGVDFEEIVGQF